MSFLWIALGLILRVDIGFGHAGSRARMVGCCAPGTFHKLHPAEFLQRHTTPVCRRARRAGVRFGFRRRIGSTVRGVALPDCGSVGADKTIDAGPGSGLRLAVYSTRQSRPTYKSPPPVGSAPGQSASQLTLTTSPGYLQQRLYFMTQ
jgi:hypothetical protein